MKIARHHSVRAVIAIVLSFMLPLSAFASFNGVLPLTTSGSMPAPLAAPAITLSNYNLGVGQTATVTFTFPAPPLGFTASDTSATNGTLSNLASTTNPDVYTATFTPNANTNAATNVISVKGKVTGTTYTDPSFNQPYGIAFDGTNMWVTNSNGTTISKITPTGSVTAYSGFDGPSGIAFDGTHLWVTNYGGSGGVGSGNGTTVRKVGLNGSIIGSAITVAQAPTNIAFDGSNMWVASYVDGTSPGIVTEIASTSAIVLSTTTNPGPQSIAFDGTNMWTANFGSNDTGTGNSVTKISPTGTSTSYVGTGLGTIGIASDGTNMWTTNYGSFSGAPYFNFENNSKSVSKVTPSGAITTYTGTGDGPNGIAFDGTNMWVTDFGVPSAADGAEEGAVTEVAPDGTMTTYTGIGYSPAEIAFDGTNMWTANDNNNAIPGGDSVSKITGTISPSASANYVVDTVPPPPPSRSGSSGGSVTSQVQNLLVTGNNKVAQSLINEFPSLFSATTTATTTAIAGLTTGPVATSTSGAAKIKVTLSYKSRNNSVKILQQILSSDSSLNYTSGVTGYFGRATQTAVEAFQVKKGIVKPGRAGYGSVGPKTRLALIEAYGE